MAETVVAIEQEFKLLALDLIEESKTNPRRTFDAKQLQDLTASIKEKGVIVPILVRPVGGAFEVVAGARRYRAAKKAGLDQIPAIVRELSDDQALEAQVIENLQRADVHPLEEAEGYKALLARKRHTVESLAAQVGKSISYIWQRMKLLEMTEPAKKAFLADDITAGHAVLIARLSPEQQKEAIKICLPETWVERGQADSNRTKTLLPVRVLASWIQDVVHTDLRRALWELDDQHLIAKAGACTTCPKRSGNAPGLFPEVQSDHTCTDGPCFQTKLKAWFKRKKQELSGDGSKVFFVTETPSHLSNTEADEMRGEVLWDGWKRASSKKCDHRALGIMVGGKERGQVLDICPKVGCKVHDKGNHRASTPASTPEDRDQAAKERQAYEAKRELEQKIQLETYRQVCNKVRDLPRRAVESLVAREMAYGDEMPFLNDFFHKLNLRSCPAKKLREAISELGPIEFAQVAIGAACRDSIMGEGNPDSLQIGAFAREIGIDIKALEKGIRGKFEAEQREAKRQTEIAKAALVGGPLKKAPKKK